MREPRDELPEQKRSDYDQRTQHDGQDIHGYAKCRVSTWRR
jgi:hypothetical protein